MCLALVTEYSLQRQFYLAYVVVDGVAQGSPLDSVVRRSCLKLRLLYM